MKLTFATGNQRKFQNAKAFLGKYDIELTQIKVDIAEIQSEDVKEVVRYSAEHAASIVREPVIKTDVGFTIKKLNGFPGPFIKYINKWLTADNILKLVGNNFPARCYFEDAIALAYPNGEKETIICSYKTRGTLSTKPKGQNGSSVDRLFIPNKYRSTLAEMTNEERKVVWKQRHWEELVKKLGGN